jgi:hypothetical protein
MPVRGYLSLIPHMFIYLLPLLGYTLGAWLETACRAQNFRRPLQDLALAIALFAASLACVWFYNLRTHSSLGEGAFLALPVWLILRALRWPHIPFRDVTHKSAGNILLLSGVFTCTAAILGSMHVDSALLSIVYFITLWLIAGLIWQRDGQSKYVTIAIALVTIRLFIGFIELFGSLMNSGGGFIVMGIVLIGMVSGAKRTNDWLKAKGLDE